MVYNSLFDSAKIKDGQIFDFTDQLQLKQELHRYDGRLWDVIDSLVWRLFLILSNWIETASSEELVKLILMNGRLIRGILDYKESKLWDERNYQDIIQKVIDISYNIYQLHTDAITQLSKLSEEIEYMKLEQVTQLDDSESWAAMDPYFSKRTVERLFDEIWREDYVFVTLWHWGIVPGIDVFLRLKEKTEGLSTLYPIRFSRTKHKDKRPMLRFNDEKDFFYDLIQWKIVVLFDEDSSSWNTLKFAREYFESDLPGYNRMLQVSNLWKWDYQTDTFVI